MQSNFFTLETYTMKTRNSYEYNRSFPKYKHICNRLVNTKMLTLAKTRAALHFKEHSQEYKRIFRNYIRKRFFCKKSAIHFDPIYKSMHRIHNAVLVETTDCYGWADGLRIHISNSIQMGFDLLVGTLIHEELHCFCKARGKYLGADIEHHCMRVLGDDC